MLILTLYLNNMCFWIKNTFLDNDFVIIQCNGIYWGNVVYITGFIRLKRTLVMTDVQ